MNKYLGENTVKIGGKNLKLCFDWAAIGALRSKFDEDVLSKIHQSDPQTLAEILAIGLKKHHPKVTPAEIIEASPPFVLTVEALQSAIMYGYFGNDDPLDEAKIEKKPGKKKRKTE